MYASEEAAIQAGAVNISDVHSKFTGWATFGFYAFICITLFLMLGIPFCLAINECGKCIFFFLGTIIASSILTWWVTGILIRFCSSG